MANLWKSRGGFTLIEVTIATFLFAVIAAILYGTFYLGHRAVEKGQARFEASQSERSEVELLAGYIRSAYPYRASDQSIFFSGEETWVDFVSALSSGMGGRGMARVLLAWEQGPDGDGLLALEERVPVRSESAEESSGYRNRVVLRRGLESVRMEYLELKDGEEVWVKHWDGKEKRGLPRAVRIHLVSAHGSETQWDYPVMMSVLSP